MSSIEKVLAAFHLEGCSENLTSFGLRGNVIGQFTGSDILLRISYTLHQQVMTAQCVGGMWHLRYATFSAVDCTGRARIYCSALNMLVLVF